jgi:type I restriction enzyme S subunit
MVAGRWVRAKIGDCSIVGDGAHARIQRQTSGVMYLTSRNLKDGCIDLSKVDYISNDDFEKHFRDDSKALTKPKADDVVFSIIGTIGEPYLVQKQDRFGISSSVAILRPNCQVVQPQYVYYWIKGHIFQDALYGIKGGVAQGYVSLEMIRSLPLYYPPLPTQRKIAAILSAYDDLIENNTRRIAILEEMAQDIYCEWFVHFRFPGDKGVRMVESELGPVPEGWEVRCVGDFGEVITGKTPSKKMSEYYGDYMPFIKTPSMHGNIFCIETEEYLSHLGAASQENKTLPPDTLCVSCIGSPGIVSLTTVPSQTNQQINSIILNDLSEREFLYFALLRLRETILQYAATGATMANLSKGKFTALQVLRPAKATVGKFHQVAFPMFEQIKNLQYKNLNLRQTRDLLLPRLVSGELDVSELEIDTEGLDV